jgi:hypothetical protein
MHSEDVAVFHAVQVQTGKALRDATPGIRHRLVTVTSLGWGQDLRSRMPVSKSDVSDCKTDPRVSRVRSCSTLDALSVLFRLERDSLRPQADVSGGCEVARNPRTSFDVWICRHRIGRVNQRANMSGRLATLLALIMLMFQGITQVSAQALPESHMQQHCGDHDPAKQCECCSGEFAMSGGCASLCSAGISVSSIILHVQPVAAHAYDRVCVRGDPGPSYLPLNPPPIS